jgi:cellulose synthase operon protein C
MMTTKNYFPMLRTTPRGTAWAHARAVRSAVGRSLIIGLCAGALAAGPVTDAYAQGVGLTQLEQRATYWEQQNNPDKAAEYWEQVLRANPSNERALTSLATYYAGKGNKTRAEDYLNRLRKAHPDSPQIEGLEKAIALGPSMDRQLREARALARAGRNKDAVTKYREAFGPRPPNDNLALEYYQTLGGVPGSWTEAREGLADLAKKNPRSMRFQLAYAQHLTYNEETRREGIERLDRMRDTKEAAVSEHDALIWLNASPADKPLYERFLSRFPADDEVRKKLNGIYVAKVYSKEVKSGYEELNTEKLETADETFQKALASNANDSDALMGLGIVRLRQQKFCESRDLLAKAKSRDPEGEDRWGRALESATFYCLLHGAEKDRTDRRFADAEAKLKEAIAASPPDAGIGYTVLCYTYLDESKFCEAEVACNEAVRLQPSDYGPLRGLFTAYMGQGRVEQAVAMEKKLLADEKLSPTDKDKLRAEILRARARLAINRGNYDEGVLLLTEARGLDPESKTYPLDLAYLHMEYGRFAEARKVVDPLFVKYGDDPDVLMCGAILDYQQLRIEDSGAKFRKLEDPKLPEDVRELKAMVLFRVRINDALRGGPNADADYARSRMLELEKEAGNRIQYRIHIADAWEQLGELDRMVFVTRETLAMQNPPKRATKLAASFNFLAAGEESREEFDLVASELSQDPCVREAKCRNWADREIYEQLLLALAMRDVEEARVAGEYPRAFEIIEPFLAKYPNDSGVLSAMARLYASAGYFAESRRLYERLIKEQPTNVEYARALAELDLAQGDRAQAEKLAREMREKYPDDPRARLIAGQAYEGLGDDPRAYEEYRRGLELLGTSRRPTTRKAKFVLADLRKDTGKGAPYAGAPNEPCDGTCKENPTEACGDLREVVVVKMVKKVVKKKVIKKKVEKARIVEVVPEPKPIPMECPVPLVPATQGFARTTTRSGQSARSQSGGVTVEETTTTTTTIESSGSSSAAEKKGSWFEKSGAPGDVPGEPTGDAVEADWSELPAGAGGDVAEEPSRPAVTLDEKGENKELDRGREVFRGERRARDDREADREAERAPRGKAPSGPQREGGDPDDGTYEGYDEGSPRSRPRRKGGKPAASLGPLTPSVEADLRDGMDRIESRYPSSLGVRLQVRYRSGPSGLGTLWEVQTPVEGRVSPNFTGMFVLRAIPIYLNGLPTRIDGDRTAEGAAFGVYGIPAASNGGALPYQQGTEIDHQAAGVALELRYEYRGFWVQVGSTPLGFPVPDVTGQIGWRGGDKGVTFGVYAYRRAETQSVLSYAGRTDPILRETWGGVRQNGGALDLSYDWGGGGFFLTGTYRAYTGQNTQFNHGGEYVGGVYWKFFREGPDTVSTGLNIIGMNHRYNQRHYTWGNGGYFSPQIFIGGTIPIGWEHQKQRLRTSIGLEFGANWFKEDDQQIYPVLSPAGDNLQAEYIKRIAASQNAGANPENINKLIDPVIGAGLRTDGTFAGQKKAGFVVGLNFELEYEVSRHWYILTGLKALVAPQFNEFTGYFGFRHDFLNSRTWAKEPKSAQSSQ